MVSQEKRLTYRECFGFIEDFLQGCMTTGLLIPLAKFSVQPSEGIGHAVKSWYELQLQGMSPQRALRKMNPAFPPALTRLLELGFEKSILDLVLTDVVGIFKKGLGENECETALMNLETKFLIVNTAMICAGCWNSELSKIISRAKLEKAQEVILQQQGDLLLQKYLGPKLVTIQEASVPEVAHTLRNILEDATKKEIELEQGRFKVQKTADKEYFLQGSSGELRILFS